METKDFINKVLKNINLSYIPRLFLSNLIIMFFFLMPSFLHFKNIRYDTFFPIIYILSTKSLFIHFVFYSILGDMIYGTNHDLLIISHVVFISIFLIKNKSSIIDKHTHISFIFVLIFVVFFQMIKSYGVLSGTIFETKLYSQIIWQYMVFTFIFYRVLYYLIWI